MSSFILDVLIIVTAHSSLGNTGNATGVWLEEFTTPYYMFKDASANITVASLPGGEVPIDPLSLQSDGELPASVQRFLKDDIAKEALNSTESLSKLSAKGWDIVYIPGGHGVMWDLASSQELGDFLTQAWADKAVLGTVCHGPVSLINVRDEEGFPVVHGRHVNAFSDSEEKALKLETTVPFLLETKLKELGAIYEKGPDFTSYAVRDGRLVTGQNPMSSEKVGQLMLEAVKETHKN